jgi:hypothetical protein
MVGEATPLTLHPEPLSRTAEVTSTNRHDGDVQHGCPTAERVVVKLTSGVGEKLGVGTSGGLGGATPSAAAGVARSWDTAPTTYWSRCWRTGSGDVSSPIAYCGQIGTPSMVTSARSG